MKLVVDLTRCQGYAQCAFLAPDAFTMHGDGEALLYDPEPSDELRERVLRAAAGCPGPGPLLRPGPGGGCGGRRRPARCRPSSSTGDPWRTAVSGPPLPRRAAGTWTRSSCGQGG